MYLGEKEEWEIVSCVDVEEGEHEPEEGHAVEIHLILEQGEGRNTQRGGDAGILYEWDIWKKKGRRWGS